MGVSDRDPPFFFAKCLDAISYCAEGSMGSIPYPSMTENLHHEIELVIAIGKDGFEITQSDALDHVYGYAIGLDMTRRDLQNAAKGKGRPWDTGKNFADSAPIGPIVPMDQCDDPANGRIWLKVNGEMRQDAPMDEMIWNVVEIIEDLSKYHTLRAGDLIFSGTPAGVGPVKTGDELHGGADGVGEIQLRIT
jgi:fumarylpyruvate hydrolase